MMTYNILCEDGSSSETISDLLLSYFPENSEYQYSKYFFSFESEGCEFNFIFDAFLSEEANRARPEVLEYFSGRIMSYDPEFSEERFLSPAYPSGPLYGIKTWLCSSEVQKIPSHIATLPLIAILPAWQKMPLEEFVKTCQKVFLPITQPADTKNDGVILKMEETVEGYFLHALALQDITSFSHLKIDGKPVRIQNILKYSLPNIRMLSKISKGDIFAIHCAEEPIYCKFSGISFSP